MSLSQAGVFAQSSLILNYCHNKLAIYQNNEEHYVYHIMNVNDTCGCEKQTLSLAGKRWTLKDGDLVFGRQSVNDTNMLVRY